MTAHLRSAVVLGAAAAAAALLAPAAWADTDCEAQHGKSCSAPGQQRADGHHRQSHSSPAAATPAAAAKPRGARPSPGSADPRGNNGTVKTHQQVGDTSPRERSPVSCSLVIAFFGFDRDQTASIRLAGQAPTGAGTALWQRSDVLISDDPAGGGKDADAELVIPVGELGLERLGAAHPRQGYHVRLSVDVDDAPGGAKHKMLWITPCASIPPGAPGAPAAPKVSTPARPATPTVAGVTIPLLPTITAPPATRVLAARVTLPTSGGYAATESTEDDTLPFTGSNVTGLLTTAAAALLAGAALARSGRRRWTTS